jgi:hypothetical protein
VCLSFDAAGRACLSAYELYTGPVGRKYCGAGLLVHELYTGPVVRKCGASCLFAYELRSGQAG